MTYKILRFYCRGNKKARVISTGLSYRQAEKHTNDPENNSQTCTTRVGRKRTANHGPWFDGFRAEDGASDDGR